MAVKGHPYEVINIGRAADAMSKHAARIDYPEGRNWFISPHVVRFATSEIFVTKMPLASAEAAIDEHIEDPVQRERLKKKLAAGGDFRMFVPEFLNQLGPDFQHIADWIARLPERDPRMVRKLHKVSVEAATSLAAKWLAAMARKAAETGSGRTEHLLDTETGRIWIELLDVSALVKESRHMNHCVQDYASRLGKSCRIFSLRDADGHPHVTVELEPTHGLSAAGSWSLIGGNSASGLSANLAVRQIKGYGNTVPALPFKRDIIQLLNHMHVHHDSGYGDSVAIGLKAQQPGQWRPVQDVATRVDIGGLVSLCEGSVMYLLSPDNPEIITAHVYGRDGWWRSIEANEPNTSTLSMKAVGRFTTLADQRAIAEVANLLGVDRTHDMEFIVKHPATGEFMTRYDFSDKWEIAGVECQAFPDVDGQGGRVDYAIHIPQSSNPLEIILTIRTSFSEYGKKDPNGLKARVRSEREWSVADVKRIAAVLDALGVEYLADDSKALRDAGLEQGLGARWAYYDDIAVQYPYLGRTPDAVPLVWSVTPWSAELIRQERKKPGRPGWKYIAAMFDHDGRVRSAYYYPTIMDHVQDLVRLLNSLGRKATPLYFGGGDAAWKKIKSAGGDEAAVEVSIVDGANGWEVLTSIHDLKRFIKSLGRRQYGDDAAGELAITMLPDDGQDPELDQMLARHLASWCRRKAEEMKRLPEDASWLGDRNKHANRGTWKWRLDAALRLRPIMSQRDRDGVNRGAVRLIKHSMKGERSPRADIWGRKRVFCGQMLLALATEMTETLAVRLAKWAFYLDGLTMYHGNGHRSKQLEMRWFEIYDALPPKHALRGQIAEAAYNSMYSLKRGDREGIVPQTEEESLQWLKCASLAELRSYTNEGAKKIQQVRELALQMSAEKGETWDKAIGMADRLIGALKEDDEEYSRLRETNFVAFLTMTSSTSRSRFKQVSAELAA